VIVSTVAHAPGGDPQLTGPWIAAAPVQGARTRRSGGSGRCRRCSPAQHDRLWPRRRPGAPPRSPRAQNPGDHSTSRCDDRLRPHQLLAVLAAPVEDQVDGGPPPAARPQSRPLDDLRVVGPVLGPSGWQYNALLRGHVPAVLNTNPAPSGTRSRQGNRDSGSGFRAMTSSTGRQSPGLAGWPGVA
jgi:hypothetical protein